MSHAHKGPVRPLEGAIQLLLRGSAAGVLGLGGGVLYLSTQAATSGNYGAHELTLAAMLLTATIIASGMEFTFGQQRISIGIESVPLLLAVFFLPPAVAVLTGAISAAWANRDLASENRFGRFALCFNVANSSIAMGATALVMQTILQEGRGGEATVTMVLLPMALAGAFLMELIYDVLFQIPSELHQRGASRAFLATAKIPIAANVLLPSLALIVLSPFMGVTWLAGILLAGAMVLIHFGIWTANSQQLEQKRSAHLKDSFSRYLPEGIVSDNLDEMTEIRLGGEQREVSVLFCDIRGFTSWSENREASEIILELNVLLSELSSSVFSTQGTLDKFTGDGLMAFWGAPLPQDDHAERACQAALEMLSRVNQLNRVRAAEGQVPFAIGVGVHSGQAVIGNVGHEQRLDYTAIGDTVNLSARLEAATKDIGSVLMVSRVTYDQLSEDLQGTAMRIGEIQVKGRKQAVETFALRPRASDEDLLDGIDDLEISAA